VTKSQLGKVAINVRPPDATPAST